MRRVSTSISWILFLFIASGCASFDFSSRSPREFSLKRDWARNTLSEEYHGYRRMHRMEPILTENLVIQGNAIDGVKAYNRQTGHEIWAVGIQNGVEGGGQLVEGRLYLPSSDGQFYCLEAETGLTLWTTPIRAEGLGQPLVHGGKVYFLAGNNVLQALDSQTGKVVWTYNRQEASQLSIRGGSQPNVDGDTLYVGFSDGYLVALDKNNGSLKWEALINRNKRFKDVDAFPVIHKNRILIASYDGGLYSLDKETGNVLWSRDEGGYSSVSIEGDRVYYGSSQNQVVALDFDSGKEIWTFPVKGLPTQPRFYKGLILVGDSAGPVHALDARTGQKVSEFHPGRGVTSALSIDEDQGEAYFISTDANLFALKLEWIENSERWPWEKEFD